MHSIIMKAEGVDIDTKELAQIIEERTGKETRIVVLAYLQRGGSPSAQDRMLASRMAAKAVELLYEDQPSKAIGIRCDEITADCLQEALEVEQIFDTKLMELGNILSK